MISDSVEQRRTIKNLDNNNDNNEKIILTPEIVDQIPICLAHFEVYENQCLLMSILRSIDLPEPYEIHEYLYQIVFGERDPSLPFCHQDLLDEPAQQFLIHSSSLQSFPYMLFSNEACVIQLLNFLDPSISKQKQNCAMLFLCSIFDHNHERTFIEMPIYEAIFQLISENLDLLPILTSILLYSDDLPKDIFPYIAPIVISHLEQEDIIIASRAMLILLELHEAEIEFDPELILQCEDRFIDSIDEKIIEQLIKLMKFAPEPPHKCLDRILEFIDSLNPRLIKESLYILNLFGEDWDDDQRDKIADVLLTLFYKMPKDVNFIFTSMTVEILSTIERLPICDIDFFSKVVELVDVWDNLSVLFAINTIISRTMSVEPEIGHKMLLMIKSSKAFESLAQDKNADVANNAQDVLKLADSIECDG